MPDHIDIQLNSEIGLLQAVIIHTPGPEVENMRPENVERALYSDILNLSVASREYDQFKSILQKLTQTFEIRDLLTDIVADPAVRESLLQKICSNENISCLKNYLFGLSDSELSRQLIEGVPQQKDNLTKYLSSERYELQPLHNFFFTRDAAMAVHQEIIIARLRNQVREREALILEEIFRHHSLFKRNPLVTFPDIHAAPDIYIEGGDLLVARNDILLLGTGARTSTQAIDYLLDHLKQTKVPFHLIIQLLPTEPESFIHLDMIFTLLDRDKFMIYEPVVMNRHDYETIHIVIDNGCVSIHEVEHIPGALEKLGMPGDLIPCGGNKDDWIQEREQWHSGTNFFALGPGQLIGYERNTHTLDAMDRAGFEIIRAKDILRDRASLNTDGKYVVTIEGSELSRGGGGCRCMTLPVRRSDI